MKTINPIRYDHPQVAFETFRGIMTTVDEGLFDLLTMLKKLGVETQYSCQGNEFAAYVCAEAKGFDKLIRHIRRAAKAGTLSEVSKHLFADFENGYRKIEISHFWNNRSGREGHFYYATRTLGRHLQGKKQRFSFERTISKRYGHRITVRWPVDLTPHVETLLEEVAWDRWLRS